MKDLATAYMARRYARGGKVKATCYADGGLAGSNKNDVPQAGEVKEMTETEKIKKALVSPMGYENMEKGLEEYLPPIPGKKMAAGGMVDENEDLEDQDEDLGLSGDLDEAKDDLYSAEDNPEKRSKTGLTLSKILNGVMKFHKGS